MHVSICGHCLRIQHITKISAKAAVLAKYVKELKRARSWFAPMRDVKMVGEFFDLIGVAASLRRIV